jgi:hypothetical protein
MLDSLKLGADFSGGVRAGESATYLSRPTPTLAFANDSVPVSPPGILAAVNEYSLL